MVRTKAARRSFVAPVVGMCLVAAGAADGHELVFATRGADWPLLIRADVALLGGYWLLSGRFSRGAGIAALAVCVGSLVFDLVRATAGQQPRPIFGRVAVGTGWVLLGDLIVLSGLLHPGMTTRETPRSTCPPTRLAAALAIAAAIGIALERSQVGQFPIIATVRAGRTSSGLDSLVYLPGAYHRTSRRWPLILTLHGRGESGDDIGLVRRQGLPRRVEERGWLPFIIVAPQSPDWLWNLGALEILLGEVLERYRVDRDRMYLAGNSMGGDDTWALSARGPERFAAIAPICGRGDPAWAGRLRDVPTWAFHGAEDRVVPREASERMVAAVNEAGGDARVTVYPKVGHDAWTPTYANPALFDWLLQHRRRPRLQGPFGFRTTEHRARQNRRVAAFSAGPATRDGSASPRRIAISGCDRAWNRK